MSSSIAIVGMACRFPDAKTPVELWDNVVAQRRAFRRIPSQRLRLEDYLPRWEGDPDSTYLRHAALLEAYEFDRVGFRIGTAAYRAADLVHWLALEVAAEALTDAGFPEARGLNRDTSGVLVGNSLTGEFSRAAQLRLRWPYFERTLKAVLDRKGWDAQRYSELLDGLEGEFKAPFPAPDEETLAGALSNTIAGRICNHFDLHGGGFTVDGACASSLLACANACSALAAGDLDLAIAGGVDLSLDPFELVGFARTGALATEEMRVYDAHPTGFLPGEGCGFVVLMRLADAIAERRRIHAVIRGWGISSDGRGGLTRPEVAGHLLAIKRAYSRAGVAIEDVALFEGHGTGTAVGDTTELTSLTQARREGARHTQLAAIGSIKANVGHTKAASGAAGLLKTCMALQAAVLPPTTGCRQPHALLVDDAPELRVLERAEPWPAHAAPLAAVNSMGFGGINVHLVLQGGEEQRRRMLSTRERRLEACAQDDELFLFSAPSAEAAAVRARDLAALAASLARAELCDLAATLAAGAGRGAVRVALTASSPEQLLERLNIAAARLSSGSLADEVLHAQDGVFTCVRSDHRFPRIGFLFPGQGSPSRPTGGNWCRRFPEVDELYRSTTLPDAPDDSATELAQPSIVMASLATLRIMRRIGLEAHIALGHSLGELTAFAWAGVFDEDAVLRVARARGQAMADLRAGRGAMASVPLAFEALSSHWLGESRLEIAAFNAPLQTVVSGPENDLEELLQTLARQDIHCTRLAVSHAFHSRLVADAGPTLAAALDAEELLPPQRTIVSTVTGTLLGKQTDLRALLRRQLTAPVRFLQAFSAAQNEGVDLWIEVGPGQVLSGLVGLSAHTPVVPIDACGKGFSGLLSAVGAAFVLGAAIEPAELFSDRLVRPFSFETRRFLRNPCEAALAVQVRTQKVAVGAPLRAQASSQHASSMNTQRGVALDRLIHRTALVTELPTAAILASSRFLADLHLNSIVVSQLVVETARDLGLSPPVSPTDFAAASVEQVAQALEQMKTGLPLEDPSPPGLEHWLRVFEINWEPRPLAKSRDQHAAGDWLVFATDGHPLASALTHHLNASVGGTGVALLLDTSAGEPAYELLLATSRQVMQQSNSRLLILQNSPGTAGFARTLHLERGNGATVVIEAPLNHPDVLTWAADEAAAARGFVEARYDRTGVRREPRWSLVNDHWTHPAAEAAAALPIAGETLLVTGGGRGIAAECALAISAQTGCALAILGRSRQEDNVELARNLGRLSAANILFCYYVADVTDPVAVRAAVAAARQKLGPITGILHGAGVNSPRLTVELDSSAMRSTMQPKVNGLRHVLAAIDASTLRMVAAFGSIIARTGLVGEADYALANEYLALEMARFAAQHPTSKCINIEWSVWSGTGMGERLDRLDSLLRQGVTPIPTDAGIRLLLQLLEHATVPSSVIACGRFGEPPTVKFAQPRIPFLRFLERIRLHVPGVELVAEAELSSENDPYVADHIYAGQQLFPAVLGLEAMAQVAIALEGESDTASTWQFESVRFDLPIAIPLERAVLLRLVALRHAPGHIEIALRSSATGFAKDHFRAMCKLNSTADPATDLPGTGLLETDVKLDPATDLYGSLLPHGKVFQRLRGFGRLTAEECSALLAFDHQVCWFGRALPGELLLGDPGARDAAVHALQACIPHALVVPIGVERISVLSLDKIARCKVTARERSRSDNTLIYDLSIHDEYGTCREVWQGLELRIVADIPLPARWTPPLLGPYLQHRVRELLPTKRALVAIQYAARGNHDETDRLIGEMLGQPAKVYRRPDGRPVVATKQSISMAYTEGLHLAAATHGAVGCDLERITMRTRELWCDLLGEQRCELAEQIARDLDEEPSTAATRLWTAAESLKKAGLPVDAPLTVGAVSADGWLVLRSGRFAVATFVTTTRAIESALGLAVALEIPEEIAL